MSFDLWWTKNYGDIGEARFEAPTETIKLMLKDAFEAGRKAQAEYDQFRIRQPRGRIPRINPRDP